MARSVTALLMITLAGTAGAQGYTISRPGQLPSTITPYGGGGYTISTPGQLPSTLTPYGGGGYVLSTPGQLPTTITPTFQPIQPFRTYPTR